MATTGVFGPQDKTTRTRDNNSRRLAGSARSEQPGTQLADLLRATWPDEGVTRWAKRLGYSDPSYPSKQISGAKPLTPAKALAYVGAGLPLSLLAIAQGAAEGGATQVELEPWNTDADGMAADLADSPILAARLHRFAALLEREPTGEYAALLLPPTRMRAVGWLRKAIQSYPDRVARISQRPSRASPDPQAAANALRATYLDHVLSAVAQDPSLVTEWWRILVELTTDDGAQLNEAGRAMSRAHVVLWNAVRPACERDLYTAALVVAWTATPPAFHLAADEDKGQRVRVRTLGELLDAAASAIAAETLVRPDTLFWSMYAAALLWLCAPDRAPGCAFDADAVFAPIVDDLTAAPSWGMHVRYGCEGLLELDAVARSRSFAGMHFGALTSSLMLPPDLKADRRAAWAAFAAVLPPIPAWGWLLDEDLDDANDAE